MKLNISHPTTSVASTELVHNTVDSGSKQPSYFRSLMRKLYYENWEFAAVIIEVCRKHELKPEDALNAAALKFEYFTTGKPISQDESVQTKLEYVSELTIASTS